MGLCLPTPYRYSAIFAALTMGITLEVLNFDNDPAPFIQICQDEMYKFRNEFSRRLEVIQNNYYDKFPSDDLVLCYLKASCKWAHEKGWELPSELLVLIDNNIDILPTSPKPLMNIERETLLIIIAALAKEAKIDIFKPSKAGDLIAKMTQQLGTSVGATTIERHLKNIPQALENRTK